MSKNLNGTKARLRRQRKLEEAGPFPYLKEDPFKFGTTETGSPILVDHRPHGREANHPPTSKSYYCVVRGNAVITGRFRYYMAALKHQGEGKVISSDDAHKYSPQPQHRVTRPVGTTINAL